MNTEQIIFSVVAVFVGCFLYARHTGKKRKQRIGELETRLSNYPDDVTAKSELVNLYEHELYICWSPETHYTYKNSEKIIRIQNRISELLHGSMSGKPNK